MGKPKERPRVSGRQEPRPTDRKFFDLAYEFDQELAKTHLTDLNLKFLDHASPKPGEWQLIRMVANESVPRGKSSA